MLHAKEDNICSEPSDTEDWKASDNCYAVRKHLIKALPEKKEK